MNDFDLIGPLYESAAKAAQENKDSPAQKAELARLAKLAGETLVRRSERNKPFVRSHQDFAPGYVASAPFLTAANVALSLGRPLLLTGEPGSGKTLAAYWLAHVLDLGGVLEFNVKSESRAQQLLYDFDAVSWFRESQAAAAAGSKEKIDKTKHIHPGVLGRAFGWKEPPERVAVVLIDEIDKAPRDFPNDLLLELDQMRFRIAEDDDREVVCPDDRRPVVVITSNQERRLPDPFLRRCVQHEIKLDDDTIAKILSTHMSVVRMMSGPALKPAEEKAVAEAETAIIDAALPVWGAVKRTKLGRNYTIDEFWRWLALATYGLRTSVELAGLAKELQANNLHCEQLRNQALFAEVDLAALENSLKNPAGGNGR
ncbi:MoxR family ATPase [Mesorhizobium sp. B2-4-17]|uniref:AAA family ATPase n=1 Tax=Mesorhizobium sp. B2-4-17 TaxID=2589932 RepID=UPI0011263D98|nr:MoxR family ATPase [Mesorhizobium sp. B2-4-17]TPK87363.1 MoxR family ATPase [Mesorhizobium sp. B2-4-17]